MGRSIVTLGDEDVVLLAIGRRGVQRVDRDEPAGARNGCQLGWPVRERGAQRCDSLFLDGAEELETGQEFTLGHRSLDDGRHDGDVEVGRADVLRRRDASDVDVYREGDLTLAIAPPDNLDLDLSPFLRPTWFWGMMI